MHLGRLRKARRPLTNQAREKLEEIFQRGQIPSGKGSQQRKRQLALELGIPYSKIEKWFDNRNMKRRKEEQKLFAMFLEKQDGDDGGENGGKGAGSKRKRKSVGFELRKGGVAGHGFRCAVLSSVEQSRAE